MGLRPTKLNENGSEWSIFEAAAAALPLWEPEARFRLDRLGTPGPLWHGHPAHDGQGGRATGPRCRNVGVSLVDTQQHGSGLMAAVGHLRGFAPTTRGAALAAKPQPAGHGHLVRVRFTGRMPAMPPPPGSAAQRQSGSCAAARLESHAQRPCQPVPPRSAPDTTPLRLSAGSPVGLRVSRINRQQRSEAFSLPIP